METLGTEPAVFRRPPVRTSQPAPSPLSNSGAASNVDPLHSSAAMAYGRNTPAPSCFGMLHGPLQERPHSAFDKTSILAASAADGFHRVEHHCIRLNKVIHVRPEGMHPGGHPQHAVGK